MKVFNVFITLLNIVNINQVNNSELPTYPHLSSHPPKPRGMEGAASTSSTISQFEVTKAFLHLFSN